MQVLVHVFVCVVRAYAGMTCADVLAWTVYYVYVKIKKKCHLTQ